MEPRKTMKTRKGGQVVLDPEVTDAPKAKPPASDDAKVKESKDVKQS